MSVKAIRLWDLALRMRRLHTLVASDSLMTEDTVVDPNSAIGLSMDNLGGPASKRNRRVEDGEQSGIASVQDDEDDQD